MYEALFVSLFVAIWTVCGTLPWLVFSIATRGHAGLIHLPLAIFAANVAGLAVPVVGGLRGAGGIVLSVVLALAVPGALLFARRISLINEGHRNRGAGDNRREP